MRNLKPRLPVAVDFNLHRSSWMFPVGLHMIDVEPQFLHAPQRIQSARILAHAAGHNALIAHERGDVGEVCRSSAQTRALRQQIPEHFAQPHDSFFHGRLPHKRQLV